MTLIEIVVVLVIMGLIMAAVGVNVVGQIVKARQDRARVDINNIQSALNLYKARKGRFPDTGAGLKALVDNQDLKEMPKDPWDNTYVYMLDGKQPVVVSYGGDGAPGGEGEDMDISSKDTKSSE